MESSSSVSKAQIGYRFRSIGRRIYEGMASRLLISIPAIIGATAWFSLLQILHNVTWIYNKTKIGTSDAGDPIYEYALTKLAFIISVVLVSWMALYGTIKALSDKFNLKQNRNANSLYQGILENILSIVEKKEDRFSRFIEEHEEKSYESKEKVSIFPEITQPIDQITAILQRIQDSIAKTSGISTENVSLSIIYSPKPESRNYRDWKIRKVGARKGLDKRQIIGIENTTAFQLLKEIRKSIKDPKRQKFAENEGQNFIFYPDKNDAIEKGIYYPDPDDILYKKEIKFKKQIVGSIYCKDLSIWDGTCHFCAILSLSTYGNTICEKYHAANIEKFLGIVMPQYEVRLKIELCLLYMRYLTHSKCAKICTCNEE